MKECGSRESIRDLAAREADLSERAAEGRVRCLACAHSCLIAGGDAGVCGVRWNDGGKLMVPYGYVCGIAADPIEKKPFFHVLPGSTTVSFGMIGCCFRCEFCQNWTTSQAAKEPGISAEVVRITPQRIAELCAEAGSPVVTSTYNEPVITAEWAKAVFSEARKNGVRSAIVSNGYASLRAVEYLSPVLDFVKVDLKSMSDKVYRDTVGGVLKRVLETIEAFFRRGKWLEIVTLVVPGLNDSDRDLKAIAGFIASLSKDIPWHVTAFHPAYKMMNTVATGPDALARACRIGKAAGLNFVYAGNLPGETGKWENTCCPGCGATLIERAGFIVRSNGIRGGKCPDCSAPVPGVWR